MGIGHDFEPLFPHIVMRHGPVDQISRAILGAEEAVRQQGVFLSFATFEELLEANQANSATWLPIVTIFDCRFSELDAANAFCILGRNRSGDVVACQAARLCDWPDTNFSEEAQSLRLFYRDPVRAKLPNEQCRVSAIAARGVSGRVLYSGGAWYRPDFRGRGLVGYLPRIARAYAHTLWNIDCTVTLMAEAVVRGGVFPRNGYCNIEWAVDLIGSRLGDMHAALLWIKQDEMLQDLDNFLNRKQPQADLHHRGARG
jgi:hypothetical protein